MCIIEGRCLGYGTLEVNGGGQVNEVGEGGGLIWCCKSNGVENGCDHLHFSH